MQSLRPRSLHRFTYKSIPTSNRKMAYLFPRLAYAPVRCGPVRNEFGSIFSLFDDTARELQQAHRAARHARKPFNPRFDVKEESEAYVLEGEVPGFQESDLSIEWNDNTLAISGRHETVTESGKKPETEQPTVDATSTSDAGSVKSHQATVEDEEPTSDSEVTKTVEPETPATTEPAKPEVQNLISERRTGQFLRQFAFPANAVDHEAIKASLQSGILKIVVPKAEPQASRRINIE